MKPIKTLLLTGENNHDWKRSAPFCKNLLEESEKFEVDLTTDPSVSLADKDQLNDYDLFLLIIMVRNGLIQRKKILSMLLETVRTFVFYTLPIMLLTVGLNMKRFAL
ncbi:TPA: hypothetical protein EYO77_03900 [Candidatus Poribacteria bacterium]|nr:hypothetical protein [Candidatus Poribacteria bacterium]HIM11175.1 hypothetical protein [Candidatus Poribacteria bacterium]